MKIDICFVIDCTGSMEPWIQAAKDQTFDIVRKTRQETPNAEVRVAFVGYRDYGDSPQFICRYFGDVDDTLDSIQDVHAMGGHDTAEDIAGAFLNASMLVWREDAAKTLIHIADAPPHGLQFHEPWISDRFPQGDPEGKELLGFLQRFSERNIDYTFVKINDSTNIMLKQFHDVYTGPGEFSVIDLRPQTGLDESYLGVAVHRSVTNTITRYSASQDPEAV
jgi:hypothetical protein